MGLTARYKFLAAGRRASTAQSLLMRYLDYCHFAKLFICQKTALKATFVAVGHLAYPAFTRRAASGLFTRTQLATSRPMIDI